MSKYLDLDDVAAGNPEALKELEALRTGIRQFAETNARRKIVNERLKVERDELLAALKIAREHLDACREGDSYDVYKLIGAAISKVEAHQ